MIEFEVARGFEDKQVKLPRRATAGSAGYDIECAETITIKPQEYKLIHTGLKAKFTNEEVMLMFPRSSLYGKYNVIQPNSVGVIDSDYYGNDDNDGEFKIPLLNLSDHDVTIEKGTRVAQCIFVRTHLTADDIPINQVRTSGFGSTD